MKKKTLFKTTVAIIVAIMLLATNMQVFASITETTDTATVTMTGLESGVSVTAYQIITVNYDYSADSPSDPMYTWNSSVEAWLETSSYSTYADTTVFAEVDDADTLASFYSALAAAIKEGTISLDAYGTATADSSGTATFTDVEMGYYLLLANGGAKVYTAVVAEVIPAYETEWTLASTITVAAKATEPTLTKTVGDGETAKDYSTTDEIEFTVTATIPTYEENSLSTTFKITDTLSSGLTLDESSIVVYGNGTTKLTSGTAYTITTSSSGYTITFDYDEIKAYTYVTVKYSATLNQDSTLTLTSGNTNTATLTYSNDPYSDSTATSETESEATAYTYGIQITKVNNSGDVLEGAEFTLKDSEGNTLSFVLVNGVYYLSNESTATTTLTSDSSGLVTIYGLSLGTYTLNETKAADGYVTDSTNRTITLTDEGPDGVLDDDTDGIYDITITNSSGFSLPVTGGIGTTLFVIAGVLLIGVGLGLVVFAAKKRMNK